ncbi:peroxiredoxin family protein [Aquiflexum sp. TKW24L]|uniref:peroxiredoxin family protein n=1 Tax=Aquiflexum sp. TKW24L TaxID=2942212 RepID=UPI0020C12FB8|nr:peroxiredoxin family protein [Aquiflexum sp. TKW24L]MCL6257918.1 peroxiredoxin family protein [Aquiflexum sp. TKW24L]
MKNYLILFLALAIFGCAKEKTPEEVFQAAKEKFYAAEQVSFKQVMLWENPSLGEVDTFFYQLRLQKHPNKYFEYNYIGTNKDSELSYLNDVLSSINHKDSTVTVQSEENKMVFINLASENMYLDFSAVNLFKKSLWIYKQDTAINGKNHLNFYWVQMDTVISEKKIYLENHMFINPANLTVNLVSRRLYHDGKRSQLIENVFEEYEFSEIKDSLSIHPPKGYLSKIDGQTDKESPKILAKGEIAPDFELKDLEGNTVKLSDFRGKKVLLDFSMINCGWCKIALEEFSKPDFEFATDMVPLYVNPVDPKEKMEKYVSRVTVPFPVLIDAKSVGEAYGVSGYPTFFLIDESGKIEEVEVGYSDELIMKLNKGS